MPGTKRPIVGERDQTGQRGDQCSRSADIHAKKQFPVVVSKPRKQDRRRNITDDLTGADTDKKRRSPQKISHEILHSRDPGHIPGKDKEQSKSGKKSPVDLGECFFIGKNKNQRNDDQSEPVRDQTEHDQQGKRKERKVQSCSLLIQGLSGIILDHKYRPRKEEAGRRQHHDRQKKRREHDLHEFPGRNTVMGVQIQILRIPERRQHASQVRGNILKDEDICHLLLIFRYREGKIPERQESNERHVISDKHRADKRDIDQRQREDPEISGRYDDTLGDDPEETDILKRADHGKRQEKAGQRTEIKVMKVVLVRRYEKRSRNRQKRGNTHHRVLFEKSSHYMFFPCRRSIHVRLLSFSPAIL